MIKYNDYIIYMEIIEKIYRDPASGLSNYIYRKVKLLDKSITKEQVKQVLNKSILHNYTNKHLTLSVIFLSQDIKMTFK